MSNPPNLGLKTNPIVSLFKYTWKYAAGFRGIVVVFLVLAFIAQMISLSKPMVIGHIFDSLQFAAKDSGILRLAIKNLLLLLLIELGFWVFHGTSRILERRSAFLVRKAYKQDMLDKVLDLPAAWHKDHHSGDTIDKINKASESLYSFSSRIFQVIENLVNLFGSLVILMFFDWRASLVALAASVVAIASLLQFDRKLQKGYHQIYQAENSLASAIHDYVSNIITIITLRLKKRVTKEVHARSMQAFPTFKANIVLDETKWFYASMLISVMTVGVLILNAYRSYAATGVILIGTLFTLYRYLQSVGDTFYSFASRYSEFVQQDTALKAAEVITLEHDKVVVPQVASLPKNWQNVSIRDLSFSYEKSPQKQPGAYSLDRVNLQVRRGQRIAFMGESGSGKSTTLSLLRGLYQPVFVQAESDSKDLPLGLSHLSSHVTLVPQDPELFNSTIEDNITMETKVSKKELEEAVAVAQFQSVLDRLEHGLSTNVLEKGVSLSGGEKQRLALCRGVLAARHSDLLLMDEPTSSVDAINEFKIYENIFSYFKDKTIISTIHRLHLLHFFDYIYLFKKGRIAAEGTLRDLMDQPDFQALWNNYNKTSVLEPRSVKLEKA